MRGEGRGCASCQRGTNGVLEGREVGEDLGDLEEFRHGFGDSSLGRMLVVYLSIVICDIRRMGL